MHVAPGSEKSWIIDGSGYDKLWSAQACQCLSFAQSLPCSYLSIYLRVVLPVLSGFSLKQAISSADSVMTARTAAPMCSCEGGGGSPVTKLADEACDLFKGMLKSQHPNELEQRIKCETKARIDL